MGITLNRLVSDESIVYAAVRDKDGHLLTKATIGWEPERVILWELASRARFQRKIVMEEIGAAYLGLSGPITAGSQQIGTLEIVFNKTRQHALLKDAQINLLAVLTLIFVGAVLVGVLLTRYVTKPLAVLSDVAGYYTAANTKSAATYKPLSPGRILDTRTSGGALGKQGVRTIQVTGKAGVPSSATAVAMNVTVVDATAASFLTAWPAGKPRPNASNLNYVAGQTVPNLVIVTVGAGG
ncbi:MAG: hypothetical protein IH962_06700, partial [Chloroflexi bacterium]|nr:hypothetical protein [Chloroflexota bacterium]